MRSVIRFVDSRLRRRSAIFEYSARPDCLFRARVTTAREPLPVPDGEISPGALVLELHLWNEHVPPLPREGSSVAWAAQSKRLLEDSCRELAGRLENDSRFEGVCAVGGATGVFSCQSHAAERIFQRLGFAVTDQPAHSRWVAFWEQAYAWLLMWSFNSASVRTARWGRMRRARFWASRQQFLERHAPASAGK